MSKYLLSLCIPTNGVSRWVVPNVRQIYSLGSDNSIFEVVVADNNPNGEMDAAMKEFEKYPNFHYVKTNAKGFYNIVENFVQAKGDFMIKLNHRCILHEGMIERFYEMGCKYYETKPLMFFSNGDLHNGEVREYSTFNDYLFHLSYRSSQSQGLFFWKDDLTDIDHIQFAPMSPNVSLMFDSRKKTSFVIDDRIMCHELNSAGKYGYDLFDTFAVLYLDLVNDVRIDGSISKKTFIKIKKDIFDMLTTNYFYMKVLGRNGNYKLEGIKESMGVYYSIVDYKRMIVKAYVVEFFKAAKSRLLSHLKTRQ